MHRKTSNMSAILRRLATFLMALSTRESSPSLLRNAFKVLCELAGFGFFVWAGFQASLLIGACVAGLCCWLMSWHFGSAQTDRT